MTSASSSALLDGEVPSVLALPEGDPNDDSVQKIKLGESIAIESIGPVIINADGSTRRIQKWDTLTKGEEDTAWRRISKRNEQRRAILMKQNEKEEEQQQQREMDNSDAKEL
eukprot:CAMPEP_0194362010 /NCGR_PEP_ID=MMETSP0174-20130528/9671_1 /TAXON_ID=216777 /ORGANISM="Proboscia alata, Strain PI-D3" /LENGTH=111 /DNA_ID=CAMNT_0039134569 /DNA_START=87 /DNA_END=422 /DNA_ORIENTATION=-